MAACSGDDLTGDPSSESGTGDGEPGDGDGDGDGEVGDGDGDGEVGDGDGEPGDGDGEAGDGDGEAGDGDGEAGDGDGEAGDGDGEAGDGDGEPGEVCGDGIVEAGEACDDGNADNTDACLDTCELASCGDGFVQQGVEACDERDNVSLDGCEPDCSRTPIVTAATANRSNCVVFEGQSVRCWGMNTWGSLGQDNTSNVGDNPGEMPPVATNVGAPVTAIVGFEANYCAIDEAQQLRCWGRNDYGQLGQSNTEPHGDEPGDMPAPIVPVGGDVVQVGVGSDHICALLEDGSVRCWGEGDEGQLGYGDTTTLGDDPDEMPPLPVEIGGTVVQLAVGRDNNCVLLDTGKVRCWGRRVLGHGNTNAIGDSPGEMPPPELDLGPGVITQLAAGIDHYCVLFEDGSVRCWGRNYFGELGQGDTNEIGDTPGEMPPPVVNVGDGNVVQLALGVWMSCAVFDNGKVRCWGFNLYSQLGIGDEHIGDEPGEMPPADVNLGGDVAWLIPGSSRTHNCAVFEDSSIRCWGEGYGGGLGSGSPLNIGFYPEAMPPPVVPLVW